MTIDYTAPSVDDYATGLIQNYPSLFASRTDVLYHVIVSIGTGHYWHEGVVRCLYENEAPPRTDEEIRKAYPKASWINHINLPDSMRRAEELAEEKWNAEQDKIMAIRYGASTLARTMGPLTKTIDRRASSSDVYLNMPGEVREDWASAHAEIASVVEPLWAAGHPLPKASEPKRFDKLSPETAAILRKLWAEA